MMFVHTSEKPGTHGDGLCHLGRHMLAADEPFPEGMVWIDLLEPTREEDRRLERHLGISIPTREEMKDLEPSEILYQENNARYMSARVMCQSDTASPRLAPVTFILNERVLVTVRYDEPKSFTRFASRAVRPGGCGPQPEAVLDGLIETIIDRAAEIIQRVGEDIDLLSTSVFDGEASAASDRGGAYQATIRGLGRNGDLISKVRESLVSIERVLLFLSANMARPQRPSGFQAEWRTALRDVQSIEEHATFLSSKIQFVLDATLGLVSLEQNKIIKIFSVAAVIFLPPTLIASLYGMNFKAMPELEWAWGYPMALVMMVASAVGTYLFFKVKRWL